LYQFDANIRCWLIGAHQSAFDLKNIFLIKYLKYKLPDMIECHCVVRAQSKPKLGWEGGKGQLNGRTFCAFLINKLIFKNKFKNISRFKT
jgi:hypothetical protein